MSKSLLLYEDMAIPNSVMDLKQDALQILKDSLETGPQVLEVKMRGTHSGYLVNHRVYPGVHMRKAASTWTTAENGGTGAYERPVLLNHDSYNGKPIGRVKGYKFKALKKGKDFKLDFMSPVFGEQTEDLGSGYILLTAHITNPDAIDAIINREYQTVSTAQMTDAMFCSICGHNFLDRKERCEHWPGEVYEVEVGKDKCGSSGKKKKKKMVEMQCYGVTGPLTYREVSYVNAPAQPNAQNLEFKFLENDSEDHYTLQSHGDTVHYESVTLCDTEGNRTELLNQEEDDMPDGEKKTLVQVNLDVEEELEKAILEGVEDEDTEDQTDGDTQDNKGNVEDKAESSNDNDDVELSNGEGDSEEASTPGDDEDSEAESANSDEDDESETDVELTEDNFPLANVARSLGTCILTESSEELNSKMFDGEVQPVTLGDEQHSHRMLLQEEDGLVTGYTYTMDGKGVTHMHYFEGNVNEDGTIEGTTRDAQQFRWYKTEDGNKSGPNHQHTFQLKAGWGSDGENWVIPEADQLKELVKGLNDMQELTEEQQQAVDSTEFCGPNKVFPVPDLDHARAAALLLPRFKGNAETKVRIAAGIRRRADALKPAEEEIKDDETKETPEVKDDQKVAGLKAKLFDSEQMVTQLNGKLSDKAEEIKTLMDEAAKLNAKISEALANQLALVRYILNKDDTILVESPEKWEALVKTYAERSHDSLQDGLNDLLPELNRFLMEARDGLKRRLILTEKPKERDSKVKKHIDASNTQQRRTKVKVTNKVRKGRVKDLEEDLS